VTRRDTVASPYGDLMRPDRLPKPGCRVNLVCGPPASGKTTHVRLNAGKGDTRIDLDEIARQRGYGRDRPPEAAALLLAERNERLARLSEFPADHTAWVIMGAPGQKLRDWWGEQLNAQVFLLMAPKRELLNRVRNDPERRPLIRMYARLISQWFLREEANRIGRILPGCDESGWPTDRLHPWNSPSHGPAR